MEGLKLVEVIDQITLKYHDYMKVELPRVTKLSYTIRRVHGNTHPELHEVEKTFKAIAEQIEKYIEHEENKTFQLIREYEKLKIEDNLKVMEVEVNKLKDQQLQITDSFKKLRSQTNNNVAPDDGCQTFDLTYDLYNEIEEILNNQFEVENKYLFLNLI